MFDFFSILYKQINFDMQRKSNKLFGNYDRTFLNTNNVDIILKLLK